MRIQVMVYGSLLPERVWALNPETRKAYWLHSEPPHRYVHESFLQSSAGVSVRTSIYPDLIWIDIPDAISEEMRVAEGL